jgi:hypothetical protein
MSLCARALTEEGGSDLTLFYADSMILSSTNTRCVSSIP